MNIKKILFVSIFSIAAIFVSTTVKAQEPEYEYNIFLPVISKPHIEPIADYEIIGFEWEYCLDLYICLDLHLKNESNFSWFFDPISEWNEPYFSKESADLEVCSVNRCYLEDVEFSISNWDEDVIEIPPGDTVTLATMIYMFDRYDYLRIQQVELEEFYFWPENFLYFDWDGD